MRILSRYFLGVLWCVWLTVFGQTAEIDQLPLGDAERAFQVAAGQSGEVIDTATGEVVSVQTMAGELAKAQVILLGEEHTHLAQKHRLAEILDEIAEVQPNLVLGMEFFLEEDAEILERWSSGAIDGEDFLRQVGWYDRGTYRWGYYESIMEVARRRSIPVAGLNVPREIPRAVNRRGLNGLTPEQKAIVGEIVVDDSPQHRYLIGRYFGDTIVQMPGSWYDNMYAAQCLWDTVMARSILKILPADGAVVVIVGSGHVAYDLGIGRRIHQERSRSGLKDVKVVTYCPIQAPIPDPDGEDVGHPMGGGGEQAEGAPAVFSRSLASYVGVFDALGGVEAWPTLGLKLKKGEDGGAVVSIAWPDSRAAEAGFETGDVIVDLNGETPADLQDFRVMLSRLQWGDRVDVKVRRDQEHHHLAMLLAPDPVEVEREVAPGWEVENVTTFDPRSGGPVQAFGGDDEESVVLLKRDGVPAWVVVHKDEIPVELHELTGEGFVELSLFLKPLDDGVVEIRYVRDSTGAVTDVSSLDRTGR